MNKNIKIGITEAGDLAFDSSWVDKMNTVDGVVLITKNLTNDLIGKIMQFKDKAILHASCTGMGGTVIEPNVPVYTKQLAQVQKLIDMGFPKERIVIRIDPIVPTPKGLQTAQRVIDAAPVKNFRISILDAYPHIRARFKANHIPLPYGENFEAPAEMISNMRNWLANQNPEYKFVCCAEPKLAGLPNVQLTGCVSKNDLQLLGLPTDGNYQTGRQRGDCLCLSCKTELLSHKARCQHGCLYCYWKDAVQPTIAPKKIKLGDLDLLH